LTNIATRTLKCKYFEDSGDPVGRHIGFSEFGKTLIQNRKKSMATYQIPAPEPLNGNVANNWKSFHESYADYLN
jgi:hypothetical protein